MTKSVNKPPQDSLSRSVDQLWKITLNLLPTIKPIRWVGYGLLISALFDLIGILIPPNFMNPVWELQTIGSIIEQTPMALIGNALAFLGGYYERSKWEIPTLRILSWSTFFAGLALFLFIPLGLIDTVRVDQQNSQQLTAQFNQSMAVIYQVKEELNKTDTPAEAEVLLSRLSNAGLSPEIKNAKQVAEVKDKLITYIVQSENKLKAELKATQSSQRLSLLKSSVKWNLGAFVFGFLLINFWRGTRWAMRNQDS
jgi:hypothetical protein